jgi:hypothetical protein
MQIRSADASGEHADLHVVDADLGLGHIFNPETALRVRLDQCFHCATLSIAALDAKDRRQQRGELASLEGISGADLFYPADPAMP